MNIEYCAISDLSGEHAFLTMNTDYYHIEIIDHDNTVEVYAYYVKKGQEIAYFKKNYKQITSAMKKVVALYEELND